MSSHWSDRSVGRPYVEGKFDCGDVAVRVQKDIFRRTILLPSDHGNDAAQRAALIHERRAEFARPTAELEARADGDPLLLIVRGREQHIGTYCVIDGEPWVLHSFQRIGSHRTRLRHLAMFGCTIEGFYKWI